MEVTDTNIQTQMKQKDGSYVDVKLKECDSTSIDEILAYPDVICNLMPAAYFNSEKDRMEYSVEFTIGKPHPMAVYSCTGEEWKTSDTKRKEWFEARDKLYEIYIQKKAEEEALEILGVNDAELRND